MKKINFLLGFLLLVQSINVFGQGGGSNPTNTPPFLNPSTNTDYQLIWEDNFNTFDNNRWIKANDFDHYGEAQVYLASQANSNAGRLELKLEKLSTPYVSQNPNEWGCKRQWFYSNKFIPPVTTPIGYDYKSGYVETTPKYKVPVNTYVEANITLPHLQGFWPAFWLFGNSDQGFDGDYQEIDIFEMLGHQSCSTMGTNTHTGFIDANGDSQEQSNQLDVNMTDFSVHPPTDLCYTNTPVTFGVKWTPDVIEFYVNGVLHETKANKGIYQPKTLILNFAISYFGLSKTILRLLSVVFPLHSMVTVCVVTPSEKCTVPSLEFETFTAKLSPFSSSRDNETVKLILCPAVSPSLEEFDSVMLTSMSSLSTSLIPNASCLSLSQFLIVILWLLSVLEVTVNTSPASL